MGHFALQFPPGTVETDPFPGFPVLHGRPRIEPGYAVLDKTCPAEVGERIGYLEIVEK